MSKKYTTLHPKGDTTVDLYPNIEAANIPDGSIGATKIYPNAIGNGQLAPNAVGYNNIQGGAVHTIQILDGAVTSDKIATGAITDGKLDSNSVNTSNIKDNAITGPKILNTSITRNKLFDHIYHCIYYVASSVGINFQVEVLSRYDINADDLSVDDFFDYLADYYCSEGGSCIFTKASGGTLYGTLGDEGNGYIADDGSVEFTDNNDESITIAHNTCTITTVSFYQLY